MDSRKREHLIEQLSAFIDGELTPAEKREVEAFLAQDAEARALLDELRATSQLLHELPRAKAAGRVMEGVRTRLERQALLGDTHEGAAPIAAEKRFRMRWVAAAAVIGLTFLTFYTLNPLSRQSRPTITVASADKKRAEPAVSEDRKVSPELADKKETTTDAPAPSAAVEYKSTAKSGQPARDNMDLFGQKASQEPAKSPALAERTIPAAPPVAMGLDATKAQQKDMPALAKSARREEGERDDAAVLPPAQQMVESKPTGADKEEPVIVLVELSAPDTLAQQKTADTLKNQYSFHASDDVTLGDAALKRSIESARRGNQLEAVAGGRAPGSASAGQTNNLSNGLDGAAAEKQLMRQVTNQYGRPLILRRAMPDGAIPETLQQVQSQWPAARVQVMQNQLRYSNALVTNNYANAQSGPAAGRSAARYLGGQQQSDTRVGGDPGQQGQLYAKGGAAGSASNMKQNEFYESFAVQSRTRKMLIQAEPFGALASNQAILDASGKPPEGSASQPALKSKVDMGAGAGRQLALTDALPPASGPAPGESLSASSAPATQPEGVILVYVDVAETPVPAAAATTQPDASQGVEVAPSQSQPAASQPEPEQGVGKLK